MKMFQIALRLLSLLMIAGLVSLMACEEDEQEIEDPESPGVQTVDYLVLKNAVKINEPLPTAPIGEMKLNFPEELYVIPGHDYLGRIMLLHDQADQVTGFYVAVNGNSDYHYDVPVDASQSKDTLEVIYLNLAPDEDEVTFPYTLEVKIQPHGPDGQPYDEFTRSITAEKPDSPGSCDIYTEAADAWKWEYTMLHENESDLKILTAPGYSATFLTDSTSGTYTYSLCCIQDPDFGLIEVYPGDPTKEGICNEQNPYWKSMIIDGAYTLRPYEFLFIFEGGDFIHYSAIEEANFVPSQSRICDLFAYYDRTRTDYTKTGVHDYVPGDQDVRFTTLVANPAFGPIPPFGNFTSTCHLLIFSVNSFTIVYSRYPGPTQLPSATELLDYYFD